MPSVKIFEHPAFNYDKGGRTTSGSPLSSPFFREGQTSSPPKAQESQM